MTIERHLVYDPATGHLVYDPDSGHLVYAAIARYIYASRPSKKGIHTHTNPFPPEGPYPDEAVAMADAYTDMQACSWGNNGVQPERETYKFFDTQYNTRCTARCCYYKFDTSAESGSDITAINIKIQTAYPAGFGWLALTYRLKIHISATDSPYTAWADIYNSPHFSGATNGMVNIPYTGTLNNYLFIYHTADSYAALAVAGPGSAYENAYHDRNDGITIVFAE
jgi:hypothetical protein